MVKLYGDFRYKNSNHNGGLGKDEVEEKLKAYLGVKEAESILKSIEAKVLQFDILL